MMEKRKRSVWPPASTDVLHWTEFREMAERLGIDLTQEIIRLKIDLRMDRDAVVTLKVVAKDCPRN